MKILNLYAGLGGNRKLWKDCDVTAIELDDDLARVYKRLYPFDEVARIDAHQFLLSQFHRFNFIWSSRPCQTHTKMVKATRHKLRRYTDLALYEEIMFLKEHAGNVLWVVENVVPYYTPLIDPSFRVGRHLFWCNFKVGPIQDIPRPANFINRCNLAGKKALQEWLGIHYPENIYYGDNHCPAQVLRNCVHPEIGRQIFEYAKKAMDEKACWNRQKTHLLDPDSLAMEQS